MQTKQRKFWGWGYEGVEIDKKLFSRLKNMLRVGLGQIRFQHISPPGMGEISICAPRFRLPENLNSWCSSDKRDRLSRCYGKSYRDTIRALDRRFDNPPDYVAFPENENQIADLMEFCGRKRIALVPFGGGSSVVGGVEPTQAMGYRGVVTLDLQRFNRVLEIDDVSRAARMQAGLFGPAVEAALKPQNLTLRHFPQSFEFSTLGGWLATRSGGHYASVYTHIDEFVESIRMLTPQGVLETRRLPASGAGPDPNRIVLGSEGAFGVITEAWMRLQNMPKFKASAAVRFRESKAGIAATRELSQSGLHPTNCRLISKLEAMSGGLGDGKSTVLILGFESHDHALDAWMERGLAICKKHGGVWDKVRAADQRKDAAPEDQWKKSFLLAPYIRDELVMLGVISETFESAVTWDRFDAFHKAVLDAVNNAIKCVSGRGIVTWRFTHVYPDGVAPYYTVIAKGKRGQELAQWTEIKAAASKAILDNGGTITHHHAVGRDHRDGFRQEASPLWSKGLAQLKSVYDPQAILNPGVLLG